MQDYYVVVLGVGGVGKSSLTVRYIQNKFEHENYDPTIEEAYVKLAPVNGILSRVHVIDTAGIEQFHAVVGNVYVKPGRGYLLAFSLNNAASFRELEGVINEIKRHDTAQQHATGKRVRSPIVVVGTKSDLIDVTNADTETVREQARSLKLPYYETSAKNNVNVEAVFRDVTVRLAASVQRQRQRQAKPRRKILDKSRCVIQ